MDRVLSVRVDESIARRLDQLTRQLGLTKKAVIEGAVALYEKEMESETGGTDILAATFGAWNRPESAIEIVQRSRGLFADPGAGRGGR